MKNLTIALWISLFALMSFSVFENLDRSADSVQFNTSHDDGQGTLNP